MKRLVKRFRVKNYSWIISWITRWRCDMDPDKCFHYFHHAKWFRARRSWYGLSYKSSMYRMISFLKKLGQKHLQVQPSSKRTQPCWDMDMKKFWEFLRKSRQILWRIFALLIQIKNVHYRFGVSEEWSKHYDKKCCWCHLRVFRYKTLIKKIIDAIISS